VAVLSAIHVGQPESLGFEGAAAWFDQPWTTAIFKRPLSGPVPVGRLGLDGDRQADPSVHGGPDKAVCVYSADHYPTWQHELGLADFHAGAFGENLTLAGVTEHDICVGDVWAVADVLVQVSQPRQPCWKLARKWQRKTLTDEVVKSGRTGWYFRVLREGSVSPGATLALVERRHPEWTITAANNAMHHGVGDLRALGSLDELSASWKKTLSRKADGR
jgi:MOSC domain-containing protein YiiM